MPRKPIPPHVIDDELCHSLTQWGLWQQRTTQAFERLLPHIGTRHLPDAARVLLVRAKLELSAGALSLDTVGGLAPYFDAATREDRKKAWAEPEGFKRLENDRRRLRQQMRKARQR